MTDNAKEPQPSITGKAGDYRLCQVCNRNLPISELHGKCVDCGRWICGSCSTVCSACKKVLCKECANISEKDGTVREFCKLHKPKSGGCFIATAAYGTPFAEEINVLRYWRDECLRKNRFGRMFIGCYYTGSPLLAYIISKSSILRSFTRLMLKPIVKLIKRATGEKRDLGND